MFAFVLILLFTLPDGSKHQAVGYFPTAEACEAAIPVAVKQAAEAGADNAGAACTPKITVGKVS